ncbi:cell wall metabolism sensor histidine kinase WalK [Croceicoccus sp. YJ47]|uniref:sensor histidine kinase n=1 Tax=Croceicoccus sp. YJ47 TaxID=2798724 RepID=UPI0019244274|nr:ATP-binding protein [Croceicoccus sp. YJ47]QQN74135.1 two-component sensor histidine kinase [Croceicoccus sp. YJ47]
MQHRPLPLPGLMLAFVGGIAIMVLAGDFWLGLAVLTIWAASLFLTPRESDAQAPPPPNALFQTDRLRDFLEPLGLPYLVIEGGRIILANAAAREVLGAHIVQQDARVALRHPEAVRLLDREGGGQAIVRGLTGSRSIWHVSLLPIDATSTMVELVNRTAEADISRAHTDFVANASHELRTPLASIIGYAETLIEAEGGARIGPETSLRFHRTILRESKRLQALVEDLMSLSRIEAEKHELPPAIFDLGDMARTVASGIAALHGEHRIRLEDTDAPLPVRGDRQQVDQLLRNLVDNGLKYGAEDAPVTIALSRLDSDQAEMVVTDRGPGIAAEHLPHLTRRFYRTDPGRSRAVGGTGLGLAIVKHIVERHRGRLDIRSRLGEGTAITVRLPLQGDDAPDRHPA